jgi:hypothetical protein
MTFKKNLLLLLLVLAASPWLSAQKLLKSQKIGSLSKFELQLVYGGLIRYGIDLHKVWYLTPNIAGKPDTASGLVIFPQVEGIPQPLLCYQHGTVDGPADVPSNRAGGWELAGVGAALGYVACTADYLGLGESKGFHPYIHAATEASCAVDLLYATRELAKQLNFPLKNQLFLTGYSQGGHASMALHRLLEQNYTKDFPVTAAAHLSGPYSVSGRVFGLGHLVVQPNVQYLRRHRQSTQAALCRHRQAVFSQGNHPIQAQCPVDSRNEQTARQAPLSLHDPG